MKNLINLIAGLLCTVSFFTSMFALVDIYVKSKLPEWKNQNKINMIYTLANVPLFISSLYIFDYTYFVSSNIQQIVFLVIMSPMVYRLFHSEINKKEIKK